MASPGHVDARRSVDHRGMLVEGRNRVDDEEE
jgi:hypothetical protein